jgi:predicted metal-dependent hydrolase
MTMGNSIQYEGLTIPYDITFSPGRKSISIIVHHTKRVEIKAPTGTPASFIHDLTEKKVTWIVKRLRVLDSMDYLHTERNYHEGEVFFFLGTPFTLSVNPDTVVTGGIRQDERNLIVSIPRSLPGPDHPHYIRKLVQDWYRDQASRIIGEKIQEYARVLDVEPPPFRLRNVRRRWGSCNHENNLNFNIRLAMAPIGLVEYVVMHELCHIRHKNHSRVFWESLRDVMPDCRERRDRLKREGHRYVL